MYNRVMEKTKTSAENVTKEEIEQIEECILVGGHIEYISDRYLHVSRDRVITQAFIDSIEENTEYKLNGVYISDGKAIAYFSKQ